MLAKCSPECTEIRGLYSPPEATARKLRADWLMVTATSQSLPRSYTELGTSVNMAAAERL